MKRRKSRKENCCRFLHTAACAVHYTAVAAAVSFLLLSETFTVYQSNQTMRNTPHPDTALALPFIPRKVHARRPESATSPASKDFTTDPAQPQQYFQVSATSGKQLPVSPSSKFNSGDRRKRSHQTKRSLHPSLSPSYAGRQKADEARQTELSPSPSSGDVTHTDTPSSAASVGKLSVRKKNVPSFSLSGRHTEQLLERYRKVQKQFEVQKEFKDGLKTRRTAQDDSDSQSGSREMLDEETLDTLKFQGVADVHTSLSAANVAGTFDNLTRISFMMYRLIKTHHITSMIDIPCSNTLDWMPQVLHYLDFEIPGFRYTCVVPSHAEKEKAQAIFGDHASPEFLVSREYWRLPLPTTDVAFLWNILGFITPHQSWALLKSVRQAQTKYVVLPNYPQMRSNPAAGTHHGRVNLRRAPYRFAEALRVFNNISTNPIVSKQMLLYDTERLRQDDL